MAWAQGRAHMVRWEADTDAVDARAVNHGMQQCSRLSGGENHCHSSRWRVRQSPLWFARKKGKKQLDLNHRPDPKEDHVEVVRTKNQRPKCQAITMHYLLDFLSLTNSSVDVHRLPSAGVGVGDSPRTPPEGSHHQQGLTPTETHLPALLISHWVRITQLLFKWNIKILALTAKLCE